MKYIIIFLIVMIGASGVTLCLAVGACTIIPVLMRVFIICIAFPFALYLGKLLIDVGLDRKYW